MVNVQQLFEGQLPPKEAIEEAYTLQTGFADPCRLQSSYFQCCRSLQVSSEAAIEATSMEPGGTVGSLNDGYGSMLPRPHWTHVTIATISR